MNQLFPSGGQSVGVSALTLVFPMNTQEWSTLGWTGQISLQSKGLSGVFFNTTVQKHQFFSVQLSYKEFIYPYMTTGKTIALTRWTFVDRVKSLLFIFFYFIFYFLFFLFVHGFTYVPHPDPPSHLPLHPLMHPTWAGDLFHPRYYTCFDAVLLKHPTLSFSHRV